MSQDISKRRFSVYRAYHSVLNANDVKYHLFTICDVCFDSGLDTGIWVGTWRIRFGITVQALEGLSVIIRLMELCSSQKGMA